MKAAARLTAPPWVKRTLVALLAFEGAIVVLDVLFTYFAVVDDEGIQEMFNVARELSLGNFFSSTQTAAIGVVIWLIRLRVRDAGAPRWTIRGWSVLSGLFVYLAIDDGVQIHERVSTAVADFFAFMSEGGAAHSGIVGSIGRLLDWFPSYSWQVLFGPVFAALGVFIVVFVWRRLDRASAYRVYLGLFLYGVAQGQDFVEGLETPYERLTAMFGTDPYTVPHFAKMGEETLEMVGSTVILVTFLTIYARMKSHGAASELADDARAHAPLEG